MPRRKVAKNKDPPPPPTRVTRASVSAISGATTASITPAPGTADSILLPAPNVFTLPTDSRSGRKTGDNKNDAKTKVNYVGEDGKDSKDDANTTDDEGQ